MTTPVRMGLLGLGQRGLQHLKALWQLQQEGLAQIVALGDAFEANLAPTKIEEYVPGFSTQGIQFSTDFSTLMETEMDALYICLPPNVHNGEVLQAAEASIHLFVEKPMSLFLDEAIEMEQAIGKAGIVSTVGFQRRFEPAHEAVHEIMQGKRAVMACYTLHAPIEAHNAKHMHTEKSGGPVNRVWTASRAWSGTTMVEAGIHLLDLWRYWFGDVEWVQARYVPRPPEEIFDGADNPYAYAATFGFKNGAVGDMTLSRLRKVYSSYTDHQVLWNEGRLSIEGRDLIAHYYDGEYPPAERPSAESVRHVVDLPEAKDDTTTAIARRFVEAIRSGDTSGVRSSFPDAMNSLAAVLGANVSDELGGQQVNIQELLTADKYAKFRQKPSA